MIKILVRGVDGSSICEMEYSKDYSNPSAHALAALEGITDAEAFNDLGENRWYTEDGEEAWWFIAP